MAPSFQALANSQRQAVVGFSEALRTPPEAVLEDLVQEVRYRENHLLFDSDATNVPLVKGLTTDQYIHRHSLELFINNKS